MKRKLLNVFKVLIGFFVLLLVVYFFYTCSKV